MKTINLYNVSFSVRSLATDAIRAMAQDVTFSNIQEMVVEFFGRMGEEVWTDEYALAVAVFFKDSVAWQDKRQARCATDVRQYNKGAFKCQDGKPEPIRHADGGKRTTTVDAASALDALAEIDEQL